MKRGPKPREEPLGHCKVCGRLEVAAINLCHTHYKQQWRAKRRIPCIDGVRHHEWLVTGKCRICGSIKRRSR